MSAPEQPPSPTDAQSIPLPGADLAQLSRSGFAAAGSWTSDGAGIRYDLRHEYGAMAPALYAFVVDGQVVSIGKTAVPLRQRLRGYRSPASDARSGASTNRLNHRRILDALSRGSLVDIWVLDEGAQLRHGDYPLDLPAALERAMIEALSPPWNRSHRRPGGAAVAPGPLHQPTRPAPNSRGLAQGEIMTPTVQELIAYTRSVQGTELSTLTRPSPFRVEVIGNSFEFVPASGKPRRESLETVAKVLVVFAKSNSWRRADYTKESFNASYLLALIKGWRDSGRAGLSA